MLDAQTFQRAKEKKNMGGIPAPGEPEDILVRNTWLRPMYGEHSGWYLRCREHAPQAPADSRFITR